jgi:hypothetical protein
LPPEDPKKVVEFCANPLVIVTVAEPDTDGFTCETAVTVTVVGLLWPLIAMVGTPPGATYNPGLAPLEINPVAWLPPVTPFTCHVTALLERLAV